MLEMFQCSVFKISLIILSVVNFKCLIFQLAARIAVSNLHKNTKKLFSETWVLLFCSIYFSLCIYMISDSLC